MRGSSVTFPEAALEGRPQRESSKRPSEVLPAGSQCFLSLSYLSDIILRTRDILAHSLDVTFILFSFYNEETEPRGGSVMCLMLAPIFNARFYM